MLAIYLRRTIATIRLALFPIGVWRPGSDDNVPPVKSLDHDDDVAFGVHLACGRSQFTRCKRLVPVPAHFPLVPVPVVEDVALVAHCQDGFHDVILVWADADWQVLVIKREITQVNIPRKQRPAKIPAINIAMKGEVIWCLARLLTSTT
jgi:hypothetical protein